jgi:hypothetical protein
LPADRNTAIIVPASVLSGLILAMLISGAIIMLAAASRVWKVMNGVSVAAPPAVAME